MKTTWMSVGLALAMTTAFAQENKEWCCGPKHERRAKMMEMHQKLETEWKAQDAELDKLLADVKSAPAEKKADALEAVVAKLAEQRKSDHEKFANMRKKWMERMNKGESGEKPGEGTSLKPSL